VVVLNGDHVIAALLGVGGNGRLLGFKLQYWPNDVSYRFGYVAPAPALRQLWRAGGYPELPPPSHTVRGCCYGAA
jgi:hypothetical protein